MKFRMKALTITVSTVIVLLVIYLLIISHRNTQSIYLQQSEKTIINMKKEFIKDTVNNVFIEINQLRETKARNYKKNTEYRFSRIQEELDSTEEEFIKFFIDKFENDVSSSMWTAYLWDNDKQEAIYNSSELDIRNIESAKKSLKSLLVSYKTVKKGSIEGIFGVKKSYIDDMVKREIENSIRNRKFSNNSYIWIDEVISYAGGKDYAIRKVHPKMKEQEDMYLSTDTRDVKGNLPYLEELEGIKANGELFFSYYFEQLGSTVISEKISYSKLYKDYDWIISMGVHLDEIDLYTEQTNDEVLELSRIYMQKLMRYIFLTLALGFTSLYFIQKKDLLNSTTSLENEVNLDSLTNSYSRRYGEKSLSSFFERYRLRGNELAIMMFDIDDFKIINDRYGHEVGDRALIEVVNTINRSIRSTDELIRWGGDEFIGIFPDLKEEYVIKFGEKLLDEISSLEIAVEGEIVKVSISIGFSYFKDTDEDYKEVLSRADCAMYTSKQEGKNKVGKL